VGRREELFNRELDKLLAGQPAGKLPGVGDDESLAFAGRMASLRLSPRPEFRSRLKASLLQKLDGEEARRAARPSWVQALVRRPGLAVVMAALFVAVVFGGLWASGVFGPSRAPFTPNVVRVDADTDKETYRRGEQVIVNVALKNITGETLNFNEFPPILSLMRESDRMAAYTFGSGTTGKSLAPGETAYFALTWDQRDALGNLVESGQYYVELEDLYYHGAQVKLTPVNPVEFRIA
jgi:hypothetical protein